MKTLIPLAAPSLVFAASVSAQSMPAGENVKRPAQTIRSKVAAAPQMLTPAQSDMIARIRAKTGPAREATYIAQHKTADSQNAVGAAYYTTGVKTVATRSFGS